MLLPFSMGLLFFVGGLLVGYGLGVVRAFEKTSDFYIDKMMFRLEQEQIKVRKQKRDKKGRFTN